MSIRTAPLLLGLVLLAACGGGDPGAPGGPQGLTLQSVAPLDGYVNGGASGLLSGAVTDSVGRAGSGGFCSLLSPPACAESRAFFVFDRAPLPAGAVVQSATLRVYQEDVTGDPYTSMGNLVVDHVDVGSALDQDDFDEPALTLDLGSIAGNAALEVKSLDVTESVAADILAGRQHTGFRLRFSTGADGSDAMAILTTAEDPNDTGSPPVLVIVYARP